MFNERSYVRVLEVDPDFGGELDPDNASEAVAQLVVVTDTVEPGRWDPSADIPTGSGQLGVLVVEGLLARQVQIAQTSCGELVGRGDILRPWEDIWAAAPMPSEVEWNVLEPTTLGLLDGRFIQLASRWPPVVNALIARGVLRAQALAISLAISCVTGLELRLLVYLWHIADRWGKVQPGGVTVPLPLTHQTVAALVGASRPSVSTAFGALERDGLISKRPGGGWILHGEPPEAVRLLHDRRAAAQAAAEVRDESVR